MLSVIQDKTALVEAVERLSNQGSFAVKIGEAALLADKDNLKTLVTAFPDLFKPRLRLIK